MAQPVFYDPRRARWKRLRTLLDVTGMVVSAVVVVFLYNAIKSEPLPKLLLQYQKKPYHHRQILRINLCMTHSSGPYTQEHNPLVLWCKSRQHIGQTF